MEAQLRLLSAPEPTEQATQHQPTDDAPALEAGPVAWRLSSSTRDLGRRGIEHARAALQSARSVTNTSVTNTSATNTSAGDAAATGRAGDAAGHQHSSAA